MNAGHRQEDDRRAVSACLAGRREAFAELVDRYQGPVYNLALRMLGDREEARDLAQTVFVRAFEKLAGYDPRRKFFSWLYRIAVHESLDALDRRRRASGSPSAPPPKPADGPDALLDRERTSLRVRRAILDLPPTQRIVVVLRHFRRCSYREIAEILDIEEKTVKSRLFDARRGLRQRLSPAEPGSE